MKQKRHSCPPSLLNDLAGSDLLPAREKAWTGFIPHPFASGGWGENGGRGDPFSGRTIKLRNTESGFRSATTLSPQVSAP